MNQYQSESIDQLITALAKAQGEMSAASKDCKGYNYKYADLASVWGACRDALSHNGLAVTQIETQNENGEILVTVLGHSSGQWIRSITAIRVKPSGKVNELQERGSVLTYLRRYSLSAIVGVAPAEDDDGNSAKGYQSKPDVVVMQQPPIAPKIITKEQADDLRNVISKCSPEFKAQIEGILTERKINGFNNIGEQLFKNMMPRALADMQQFQASIAIEEPIAI